VVPCGGLEQVGTLDRACKLGIDSGQVEAGFTSAQGQGQQKQEQ